MSSPPRMESYAKPILKDGVLGKRKSTYLIEIDSPLKHKFFIKYTPSHFDLPGTSESSSTDKDSLSVSPHSSTRSLSGRHNPRFSTSSNLTNHTGNQLIKKSFPNTINKKQWFSSNSKVSKSKLSQFYQNSPVRKNSLIADCSLYAVKGSNYRNHDKSSKHDLEQDLSSRSFSSSEASIDVSIMLNGNNKVISPIDRSIGSIQYAKAISSPDNSDFLSSSPYSKSKRSGCSSSSRTKSRAQKTVRSRPGLDPVHLNVHTPEADVLKAELIKASKPKGSQEVLDDTSKPKSNRVTCTSGRGQKPRWQRQDLMVYMALCNIPGQMAKRAELLKASVELDIKIAKEKGIPRTFSGKTPVNSASACLTTNKYNLFEKFSQPDCRFQYFKLTFPPGDFVFAVKKYKEWESNLYKNLYPVYFGKPSTLELDSSVKASEKVLSNELQATKEAKLNVPKALSPVTIPCPDQASEEVKPYDSNTLSPALIPSPVHTTDLSDCTAPPPTPSSFETLSPSKSRDSTSPAFHTEQQSLDSTLFGPAETVPTSWEEILEIKTSTIPNAGKGLFAKRFIPAKSILGYYFGTPMTEYDFDNTKDKVGLASHYSIMYQTMILDATDSEGQPFLDPNGPVYCPFHFMNEHPEKVNAAFLEQPENNQIACVTIFDVQPGQEVFVFYGTEFEREHYSLSF